MKYNCNITLIKKNMRKLLTALFAAALLVSCQTPSSNELTRGTCTSEQSQAFDSVWNAVYRLQCNELHSLLIAHNDTIIYERYAPGFDANTLHILWSATKTFTATAVGFAVQEGLVDLNTPIVDYIPAEELPDSVAPAFRQLTLDHLLKMSSGLPVSDFTDRIRAMEDVNALHEAAAATFRTQPGEHFRYNNMDTYLAGYVITRATGMSLEDYLNDRLFRHIGIRDWVWEKDPQGICCGAWGLYLSPESLMRMGLFMLHKGEWKGQRLLNEEWFDLACTTRIMQNPGSEYVNDWNVGYGYQVWMCKRPNVFRIDGMWGQFSIVMPDKNTVCVMNSLCNNTGRQLDAVWEHVWSQF